MKNTKGIKQNGLQSYVCFHFFKEKSIMYRAYMGGIVVKNKHNSIWNSSVYWVKADWC